MFVHRENTFAAFVLTFKPEKIANLIFYFSIIWFNEYSNVKFKALIIKKKIFILIYDLWPIEQDQI